MEQVKLIGFTSYDEMGVLYVTFDESHILLILSTSAALHSLYDTY